MPFDAGLLRDDALVRRGAEVSLSLRLPWMRTLPWSAIRAVAVEVDGAEVPLETITWKYGGAAGALDDVKSSTPYWVIGTPLMADLPLDGQLDAADVSVRVDVSVPYLGSPESGALAIPMSARKRLSIGASAPLQEALPRASRSRITRED